MNVAIGYVPGAFGQGGQDPNFLRQLVQVGDTYGYDSLWLSDRIVGQQFSLEPIVALSMVAAYSDRLKFGTSVLALPIRNPVVLAKQIATLDYLSRGRCFPAVGLGQDDPTEYEACGVLLPHYTSPDGRRAVGKAASFVTRQRPDVPFTAFSAVGTTEHIAERIHQYVDAGAAKFVVRPLCPGEEAMAQLEMMGQEIVPLFHPPTMSTTDKARRP